VRVWNRIKVVSESNITDTKAGSTSNTFQRKNFKAIAITQFYDDQPYQYLTRELNTQEYGGNVLLYQNRPFHTVKYLKIEHIFPKENTRVLWSQLLSSKVLSINNMNCGSHIYFSSKYLEVINETFNRIKSKSQISQDEHSTTPNYCSCIQAY